MDLSNCFIDRCKHILVKVACYVGVTARTAVEQSDFLGEHNLQVLRQDTDLLSHDQNLLVLHVANLVLAKKRRLAVVLDLGLGVQLSVLIFVVEA